MEGVIQGSNLTHPYWLEEEEVFLLHLLPLLLLESNALHLEKIFHL